jgi:hypothetical protein
MWSEVFLRKQFPLIRASSIIIFCIAMMSIMGHLSGKEALYTWVYGHAGMGLPTALCFVVTSWSLFVLGLERGQHYEEEHKPNAADRTK